MDTEDAAGAFNAGAGRRRRTFTAAFKAEAIECCLQLGVSIAAVARAYDLHPNLLRRWVVGHQEEQARSNGTINVAPTDEPVPPQPLASMETTTTFVPVKPVSRAPSPTSPLRTDGPIVQAVVRIELRSGARDITLHWPAAEYQTLAQLLREVLA